VTTGVNLRADKKSLVQEALAFRLLLYPHLPAVKRIWWLNNFRFHRWRDSQGFMHSTNNEESSKGSFLAPLDSDTTTAFAFCVVQA
jgi:hypothetical protein